MKQKTVEVLYTSVYEWNIEAYQSKKYRVIGNQGSSRSTKTYSISQLLALYIPYNEKKSISIVSPSLPHLKRGAMRDFFEIIENAGIYSDDNHNKSDSIYYYPNGSYVEFFGVEDVGKVRGPGRDILFINEANLIPHSVYTQLALRTKEVIFIDFNPVDEMNWVYDVVDYTGGKDEQGRDIKPNLMIHSTYKDNPFLPADQRHEIEKLKLADENLWNVFGLGLRGKSSELIYNHWKICEDLPLKGELFMGCDFGYNVPSALVMCELYEGTIYVKELLYEPRLTTSDLIEKYKDVGVSKTIEIFCDCAEPKTIEELFRAGYNVKEADKDVTEGIRKVKSYPLHITSGSTNILKEIKGYKWRTDMNGKPVKDKDKDEPVKFNDHSMDAIRYAVFTRLAVDQLTWLGF
jgi:phage terminase large subunit